MILLLLGILLFQDHQQTVIFVVSQAIDNVKTVCLLETESLLLMNSFEIAKTVTDLNEWTELQRTTTPAATVPAGSSLNEDDENNIKNVCTIQDSNKITCLLDYGNNPITRTTTSSSGSTWCINTPNTIYIETTYI
jgi:hypothetical protein